MSVRAVGALSRAAWYHAKSYRVSLLMQLGGLLFTVVPVYFVANALQPTMAATIAGESEQFFPFILVGMIATLFLSAGMTTLQGSISGGIANGYFESLLVTRTPVPFVFAGLTGYGVIVTIVRAAVLMVAGWILGAKVSWHQIGPALLLVVLLFVVYWGIGLVASALIVAFRTAGPLTSLVTAISVFFGGVYYPVSAIPSWLRSIADVTPMAYGLRALRRVLLLGEGLGSVSLDLGMLASMGALSLLIGSWAMTAALRYAKKSGTLGTY
jgi:ABC-2 type transport system permease protein